MIKSRVVGLMVWLLLLAGSNAWAQTYHVLDTGDPAERVCNPKSYTDLGNGIVRDNVTELEWVQDGNLIVTRNPEFDNDETPGDGAVTWQHALDYIDLLNDDGYLGYRDWRLPVVEELSTLVDAGRYEPAIDTHFFPVTEPFGYWSATTTASFTDSAWVVGFMAGGVGDGTHKEKKMNVYVRAVRGERCASLGAFVSNGDGTVTDMTTGLMWQQCNSGQLWDGVTCIGSVVGLNWGEAVAYVQELNDNSTYGYDDWRLPTSNELQSLIDYRSYDPATAFPSIRALDSVPYWYWYKYWSSTFFADAPHLRWFTEFYYGNTLLDDDTRRNYYARAVRGGPCWVDEAECLADSDCDDALYCNGGETCDNGTCVGGTDQCEDDQYCDEPNDCCVECLNDSHCNDGLFCNGVETCADGVCIDGTEPCSVRYCDEPTDRCLACLNDSHCSDGIFCNGAEQCVANQCSAGTSPCGPGDYCDEPGGRCVECLTNGHCSDGVFCNGEEICTNGICGGGAAPCKIDEQCDEPNDRCVECLNDTHCDDDGRYCTGNPKCTNNVCGFTGDPCGGDTPVCDETGDRCVACLKDNQCDGFCVSNMCIECRNNADCSDAQYCTGTETCASGECAEGTNPCGDGTPACDEAGDRCVECTSDTHCPAGYRCTGNACVPRGTMQITKATIKAGKARGVDSMKFSGTLNATTADVDAAMNGMISLTIEAAGIPDLDESTFTFPINATAFKKGKYKSPKVKPANKTDPIVGLAFDTIKGKMSFSSKNLNLTGLACPITVRIQFGNYAAVVVLNENIVNGTKPCPSL